jgi:hypothetical protein
MIVPYDHSVDRLTQGLDLSIFTFCIKCSLLSRQESKCKMNSNESISMSSYLREQYKYWLRLDFFLESFVYSVFKVRFCTSGRVLLDSQFFFDWYLSAI